jgi:fatty acid desaturase
MQYLAPADLYPTSTYVRALRPELPVETFKPARSRLLAVPVLVAIVVVAMLAITNGWLPWPLVPVLSLVIGASFACLTFVAHEAMHGGIVRGRFLRHVVGTIGFLPFMLSPRLWAAWHGRVHHARANLHDDPDMYPLLDRYERSPRARFSIDHFSLGGRRWRGALSLLLGFTVQSADQLIRGRHRKFLGARQGALVIAETAFAVAVWATVAALVGGVAFIFVYVVPLLIANAFVMAFILTNHSLSPRVAINDPLVSSLTVTTPRWFEWMTLGFGFHVEHHVFPAMSSRHARKVRALLIARWPERYQSMPLVDALRLLHRTARVYKDATTLVDAKTGLEYPTLRPGPVH